MLSDYCREIVSKYNSSVGSLKKLTPNLCNKNELFFIRET